MEYQRSSTLLCLVCFFHTVTRRETTFFSKQPFSPSQPPCCDFLKHKTYVISMVLGMLYRSIKLSAGVSMICWVPYDDNQMTDSGGEVQMYRVTYQGGIFIISVSIFCIHSARTINYTNVFSSVTRGEIACFSFNIFHLVSLYSVATFSKI